MKNTNILGIIAFIVIVVGSIIFLNSNSNAENNNGNVIVSDKDAQKITLGIKNYNYYPNTIEVEAGKPVEITLDNSVGGCYRSFNIKDLGISQNSRSPSDKVIFTPTKPGTYAFACSMGMGYGKLIVK